MNTLNFKFIDIIRDFMKFQDSKKSNDSSYYSSNYSQDNITHTKMDYKRTSFMIELMLIDADEENKYPRFLFQIVDVICVRI